METVFQNQILEFQSVPIIDPALVMIAVFCRHYLSDISASSFDIQFSNILLK